MTCFSYKTESEREKPLCDRNGFLARLEHLCQFILVLHGWKRPDLLRGEGKLPNLQWNPSNIIWEKKSQYNVTIWIRIQFYIISQEYQRDVHIGYGVLVILPFVDVDGSLVVVTLFRTFTAEPASPIVQVRQILYVQGEKMMHVYFKLIFRNKWIPLL